LTDRRLRIVETAEGVGAAACGRLFAALGHDVVTCEPTTGSSLRRHPPLDDDGQALIFRSLGAGKRSVAIDVNASDDDQLFSRLLQSADVLITDQDPEQQRRAHPHLVVTSITGFGLGNHWSRQPDDTLLAEAYGGLATMIGHADRRPLSLGADQIAYAAAYAAFLGTAVALAERDRTGAGDLVEVAMCDIAAYVDWKTDVAFSVSGVAPRRRGPQTGRWRMVRAADGWIGVIYQPEHWRAVRELVGDPRLEDPRLDTEAGRDDLADVWWPILEDWASSRSRREAYQQAQALGLPFGYVATVADIAESDQYKARGFVRGQGTAEPPLGPLVQADQLVWTDGSAPILDAARADLVRELDDADRRVGDTQFSVLDRAAAPSAPSPLANIVVLDLGTITAGAASARVLADYGATVIKVESPSRPDPFRRWNPPGETSTLVADQHETTPVFESNNLGKLGIALDLKDPDDRQEFLELARTADVVVENFRVGVTARLGVDFETLKRTNPRLIYLSLSSQGQTGPQAGDVSFGSTLDLISGLASVTGYDGDRLIWSSDQVNYPDQVVSLLGPGLVVYCLQQGIRGVHLDVAQAETVSWTLAARVADYQRTGRLPAAAGNSRPGAAPRDTYPTRRLDEWVAVVCLTDGQRRKLAEVVGIEIDNASEGWWRSHRVELDEALSRWTMQRLRSDCVNEFHRVGVPAVPVLDAADRAADRRFVDRGVFLNEPARLKGYPFQLASYLPRPARRAPRLGADSEAVLKREAEVLL
jgi:crotonobetainyl-CoA:carnitine CoA-transferase CaiB-like acyl-CoA transferase